MNKSLINIKIILIIIHTSGLKSIWSRLVRAFFEVSIFWDGTWFINCWIGSTGAGIVLGLFVIVAVLYGLTFIHGLDDIIGLLGETLNIKCLNLYTQID